MVLPDKYDYADYYTLIESPIAMDMILHRIKSPYYNSVEEFRDDFLLMFANACRYNMEGSVVYEDAMKMKNIFLNMLQAQSGGVSGQTGVSADVSSSVGY